ncbi:MAG TPA: heparinase II/III family protein, partial [Blastocatellia bacterium]|nr:heparinase II/III family protein [Blastocatellia bacterium]
MSRVSIIREKLRGMTAREVVSETLMRSGQKAKRAISLAVDDPETSYVSDRELESSLSGVPLDEVADSIRNRTGPHLTVGIGSLDRTSELIGLLYPDSVEEARRAADNILKHQITIFERTFDLGPVIDWHADPATGVRWPLDHYTRVPIRLKPGSDVRVVWEMNRLYHFTELGRAYALTRDERYAEEFLLQLASWYEDNPPRFGVNWTVAMEVSIRAINLIAAMEMFRSSPVMTDDAIKLILKALLAHGKFIKSNLEFSYRTPSNHYLCNLIGLFVIGLIAPELRESKQWVSYSAPRLIQQLKRQVLADGVSYEGAIGYHRLVVEIYTLFFALAQANGIELPGDCWERLEAMFTFVSHYLKPDGTAPLIGDSDDGRILKFKPRPAIDHSYLMPIAAVLLENEAFKESSRIDEEALWWFGVEGHDTFEGLQANENAPRSRGFAESQIYVMREGTLYAIIDCGDHGANGRGSHAHSD